MRTVWNAPTAAAVHRVAPGIAAGRSSGGPPVTRADAIGSHPGDRGLDAMREAFEASGGLARSDDLARMLKIQERLDIVRQAKLIVANGAFGFEWHRTLWIPMFQIDARDMSIKAGPRKVVALLGTAFDGWTLAAWFSRPNAWLHGHLPVNLLDSHLAEVNEAARADLSLSSGVAAARINGRPRTW
jgi:hypothetical protein